MAALTPGDSPEPRGRTPASAHEEDSSGFWAKVVASFGVTSEPDDFPKVACSLHFLFVLFPFL